MTHCHASQLQPKTKNGILQVFFKEIFFCLHFFTPMDTLQAAYTDADEASTPPPLPTTTEDGVATNTSDALASETKLELVEFAKPEDLANVVREDPENAVSEDFFSNETSNYGTPLTTDRIDAQHSPKFPPETDRDEEEDDADAEEEEPPPKKQKQLSDLPKPEIDITEMPSPADIITPPEGKVPAEKSGKILKRKSKDVWTTTSRKGKKRTKQASYNNHNPKNPTGCYASMSDKMLITPVTRFPDRSDDSPDLKICLSKVYKAEKIELSEDRLRAASTKGYRMVRATRGVTEGAWYFEIKVMHLGDTGHTRLGWSTDKGDLQAPVGYDGNSYGYRDIDGSKVHKALREKYGEEWYKEGDVIGVYINLPDGDLYAPNPPCIAWYKGQRYVSAPAPGAKEDPLKVVPGSEISFFKNGICQGVAYRDLYGGRYYPAASMYTLPNQPNCVVKFNFGPGFERFPDNFGERRVPRPVIEVPYQGYDGRVENGSPWKISRMSAFKLVKNYDSLVAKAAERVG